MVYHLNWTSKIGLNNISMQNLRQIIEWPFILWYCLNYYYYKYHIGWSNFQINNFDIVEYKILF